MNVKALVVARPLHLVAFVVVGLAASACDSCGACGKTEEKPAEPPKKEVNSRPEPQMPAPGTDADNKRVAAIELAKGIDGGLSTFKHDTKGLDGTSTAEAWWVEAAPMKPQKLIIKDGAGAVTTMYFDDKGMLAYAIAPDGIFIFHMEGLALWLDGEQRVKRGIKPQEAAARSQALKKSMTQGLEAFRLR